jgi:hypothetical protein
MVEATNATLRNFAAQASASSVKMETSVESFAESVEALGAYIQDLP